MYPNTWTYDEQINQEKRIQYLSYNFQSNQNHNDPSWTKTVFSEQISSLSMYVL